MMSQVNEISQTVFVNGDVREMTQADREVIRSSDDADGLLDLQLKLRAGGTPKALRVAMVVLLVCCVATFVVALTHPEGPLLLIVGVIAVGAFGYWLVLLRRTRNRVVRVVAWLGDINFRLNQLAAHERED